MKNVLKIVGMLLVGISMLNATECTSEKKAQMIMNGIEQSVIDEMCSPKQETTAQQPINITINNSSSADNTNTNTVDASGGYDDYSKSDSISRDRMYIAVNVMSGSGEYKREYTYSGNIYTTDISGSTTSLSLGYVFDSNNRFEISSATFTVDELEDLTIEGIDFNWIWTMGSKEVQSGNMRPYLLFGFGSYTISDDYYDDTIDAIGVNLGLGIMYPVGDALEIDLGYHIKSIGWDVTDSSGDSVATDTFTISGLNISLRLKF